MRLSKGFTLIELVAVLVILAITATIGSRFIVVAVDGYRTVEQSDVLVGKAGTSIEQVTRYLRNAVPNSVRVGASGNCVEWFPGLGGSFYEGQVADAENMAPLSTSVSTTPFSIELASGNGYHIFIGAMSADEIYTSLLPSSRGAMSTPAGATITSLTLSSAHRFERNSISQRVFVGDDPKRICLSTERLVLYENYGVDTSALGSVANPGGSEILLASGVSADGTAFALSAGSEDRNTTLDINLTFSSGDFTAAQFQKVFIRNVP